MKKIFYFFFLIFLTFNNLYAEEKIAYIDINYILNNSNTGKTITAILESFKKEEFSKFENFEKEIKIEEDKLIAKKNILKEVEYNKKVEILKDKINKFIKNKKDLYDERNRLKNKYTTKFLEILNPILTNYVENNSISILLPKNNILIGKKNLDITDQIIKIINDKNIKID